MDITYTDTEKISEFTRNFNGLYGFGKRHGENGIEPNTIRMFKHTFDEVFDEDGYSIVDVSSDSFNKVNGDVVFVHVCYTDGKENTKIGVNLIK